MFENAAPTRKKLLASDLNAGIERFECHQIELSPAQKTGLHLHQGGVIGYVIDGEIAFQIEGQESVILKDGDAFFEPPGARITQFDNFSETQAARFVAVYPLSGGQPIITMLNPKDEDSNDKE